MSALRPISRTGACPSIQEIATSILSPTTTCQARLLHNLPRRINPQMKRTETQSKLLTAIQARNLSRTSTQHRVVSSPYSSKHQSSHPPQTTDRGPASSESTQTDFGMMDVLGNTPVPSTAIDACLWDGFHMNNGVKVTDGAGVVLVGGEVFAWRPWNLKDLGAPNRLVNSKGQWDVGDDAWGVLGLVWPKPDLLILGLGPTMAPLSPATRKYINSLGIRVDIQDTRNAAAQYNLLATERGLANVAAALIPLGWRENIGVKSSSS